MKKKEISVLFKVVVGALGFLGIAICINLPNLIAEKIPFSHGIIIANIVVYGTAIPYFLALISIWKMIAVTNEQGLIATENSNHLRNIAIFSGIEVAIYFIIALASIFTLTMSINGLILIMIVILTGFVIMLATALGSYLIAESMRYKEDSESVI